MWDLLKKIVDIFFSEKKPKKLLKKSNHIPIKNVKVIESNNQAIINNQVIKKNVKVLEKEFKTNNDFKELPYKFGKVKGYFSLGGCENLTSLKNCPNYVVWFFKCNDCSQLDSLEGYPKEVLGDFWCRS